MPLARLPFASLRDAVASTYPSPDAAATDAARRHQDSLTKPPGSLGRLEEIALHMAGWRGTQRPAIGRAQALVFAGNHGVCAQGVNVYPQAVTAQMVANFAAGGAAINQLCRASGADLSVIALDLDRPTADITGTDAMSAAECLDAINRGAAAVDAGADILVLGEMGIGNSTIAAAMALALFGGAAADWCGPGTGADAAGVTRKAGVVERALARHARDHAEVSRDGLVVLTSLGGREQAALCGAILAARLNRIPVLLDGFICTAAAAALHGVDPCLLDHCLASHASAEPGHRRLLERLGKVPLLTLDMRLGEGSGAALALGVVRAALECHNGMATFGEAGVSET